MFWLSLIKRLTITSVTHREPTRSICALQLFFSEARVQLVGDPLIVILRGVLLVLIFIIPRLCSLSLLKGEVSIRGQASGCWSGVLAPKVWHFLPTCPLSITLGVKLLVGVIEP